MKSKTVFLITVAFVYGITLRNKKNPPPKKNTLSIVMGTVAFAKKSARKNREQVDLMN